MLILIFFHETDLTDQILEFCGQFNLPPKVNTRILLAPRVVRDRKQLESIPARLIEYCHIEQQDIDIQTGETVHLLSEELARLKPDLMVFYPFKARTGLDQIFHRPLPVKVSQVSTCPVLFPKGNLRPIQKILVCDSGGQEGKPLSTYTSKLAQILALDEEITVLHVMSQITAGPGVRGQQLRMEADALIESKSPEGSILEQDIKIIESSGIHPTAKVRHGFVDEEILAEAKSGDYDLVVIGAHGSQGWQRYLLEDLARKLLIILDRPVLVVK